MILTYYQSVELMTFLPVLLSPSNSKTTTEKVAEYDEEEVTFDVYPMWNAPSSAIEVNGAAFY